MKKATKTILAALCAFPMLTYAADFSWLTFTLTDNTEMSVAADGLTMEYEGGNLKLTSDKVDQTLLTEKIRSMRFTSVPAGVDGIDTETGINAEYYNMAGIKAGRFNSHEEARKALPSGIYIVKDKSKTFKIVF